MKYFGILLISVIGLVAAETFADYHPKAFYTIDENGNVSPVRPISEHILNRARRQIQPFQPFGFQQGFPNFPAIQPGQGQGSFVSSSQTLNSRFGDDEPIVTGQSTVVHHNNGQYHQVNTNLRPDGTYTSNKYSGRVKRQQSQTQSQDGQGGNQLQSQSQNQPQGQQSQIQSQGQPIQGSTTIPAQGSAPGDNSQYGNDNNQGSAPQGGQQPYNAQTDNRNNGPDYQQGQGGQAGQPGYQQGNQFPFLSANPFGIGAFGQQGFTQFGQPGFQQPGFGPGFGFAPFPNFQQPGFGAAPGNFAPQGTGSQTVVSGSTQTLDNRFGEEEPVVTGGQTVITSQNGNFHQTTSILQPNGQVVTTNHSGKFPEKK